MHDLLLPTMYRTPMRPLLRASLASKPSNGHEAFIPQIRKLVFEFSEKWASSANTRTYIWKHLEEMARKNPHVEVVVRERNEKEPIVRGFYRTYPGCLHHSNRILTCQ